MKSFCIIFVVLFQVVLGVPINERIAGGSFAKEGQFPYQVSLRTSNAHYCGGAIISEKTILTGQACYKNVEEYTLTAVVGTIKMSGGGTIYEISKFLVYPGWMIDSDLAIAIVTKPIIFNSLVQPVKVPTYKIEDGATLVYSGWGVDDKQKPFHDILKFFNTKKLSSQECNKYEPKYKNQFCTFAEEGAAVCQGDIGGPLVVNGEIHGVSTYANIRFCEIVSSPDWFANVFEHIEWILENME